MGYDADVCWRCDRCGAHLTLSHPDGHKPGCSWVAERAQRDGLSQTETTSEALSAHPLSIGPDSTNTNKEK